jgi:hypothetical protein
MNTTNSSSIQIINRTQKIRSEMIDTLIKNGIPTDPDNMQLLLKILADTDKTALTNIRIEADINKQTSNEATVNVLTNLLLKINEQTLTKNDRVNIPMLSKDHIIKNPIKGEKEIGVVNLSLEDLK